jgi:choline dehydrogenase
VSLASADPSDPPRIAFDLLGDDRDVAGLTAAARRIRRIFEAPALARRVVSERTPGAATDDDGAWDGYFRETAFRLCHPVGTCAMGAGQDAVVSPALQVHGVESLRVIDASVMPVITTGNTMAPTIMIAERGGDLVLGRA